MKWPQRTRSRGQLWQAIPRPDMIRWLPALVAMFAGAILSPRGGESAAIARIDPARALPGSFTVLRVFGAAGGGATVNIFARTFPLFPADGGLRAIIPVPLNTASGIYPVVVHVRHGSVTKSFRVLKRPRSPVRRLKGLTVTAATTKSLRTNRARFNEVLVRPSPRALWSGPFRYPVSGRITSRFGVRRNYGGGVEWTHKGVDFGLPAGSPVVASAAGIVVISERMGSYGNTVVLDHGQTVFSSHLHLVSREVRVGRRVEQGQIIGTVGATGLALGAHLHLGFSIHGVPVDPLVILDGGLP